MKDKAIHEIKVSEICKLCQINRATFYDHYRDVFDLVQDMEQDILMDLQKLMMEVSPEEMGAAEVSRMFFAFLEEHRETLYLLITNERSQEFCTRLDSHLIAFSEKKFRQNYVIPDGMERELRCAMEFVCTGYYRFFINLLANPGMDFQQEAEICAKMGDACLELLFRKKTAEAENCLQSH